MPVLKGFRTLLDAYVVEKLFLRLNIMTANDVSLNSSIAITCLGIYCWMFLLQKFNVWLLNIDIYK